MIAVNEKNRELDFIRRTKDNYLSFKDCGKYEVTLLINSSLGLFIYPKEKYFDFIEDNFFEQEFVDEMLNCYKELNNDNDDHLNHFCRHLRNSIAHGNFDFLEEGSNYKNDYNIIKSIIFEDYDEEGILVAKIEITIKLLSKFFIKFADKMIEIINDYR